MSKIAIIGASYLQLPAVKKAKEMGHDVICFAWPEGAVCKDYADRFYPVSITDTEKILEICRQEKIDGITTVASDLAVRAVNFVADKMGLISNPYEWTETTTNKRLMRECFRENNIPSPKHTATNNTLIISKFPPSYHKTHRSVRQQGNI